MSIAVKSSFLHSFPSQIMQLTAKKEGWRCRLVRGCLWGQKTLSGVWWGAVCEVRQYCLMNTVWWGVVCEVRQHCLVNTVWWGAVCEVRQYCLMNTVWWWDVCEISQYCLVNTVRWGAVCEVNITPVSRARKATTCWYRWPFHLMFDTRLKKRKRKKEKRNGGKQYKIRKHHINA